MTDIKLTWKDPVVREDNAVLDPLVELAGIEIFMKVAGAPDFTKLDTVAPGVQSYTVTDLPPGAYAFQADAVDKQTPPKVSTVVTATAVIVGPPTELAAPGPVTEFTATVL